MINCTVLLCSRVCVPLVPLSIGGELAGSNCCSQGQKEERSDEIAETVPYFAPSYKVEENGSPDRAEPVTSSNRQYDKIMRGFAQWCPALPRVTCNVLCQSRKLRLHPHLHTLRSSHTRRTANHELLFSDSRSYCFYYIMWTGSSITVTVESRQSLEYVLCCLKLRFKTTVLKRSFRQHILHKSVPHYAILFHLIYMCAQHTTQQEGTGGWGASRAHKWPERMLGTGRFRKGAAD